MWRKAAGTDVTPIMDLTREYYRAEATDLWCIDEQWFGMQVTTDIVRQFFNPGAALVLVWDGPGGIEGTLWAERGQRVPWSSEEMVVIKLLHLREDLSPRHRRDQIISAMHLWELWARSIGAAVVCSSTMRGEQSGFLKLHQRRGYQCRGSICYRRVIARETESNPGNTQTDSGPVSPPVQSQ